ncbi:hypothetical protein F5B18DRAFT_102078 [Nemania serpens]|nr:hypothetical protein F5B18DRAFT_102078 [Nemania serpens]
MASKPQEAPTSYLELLPNEILLQVAQLMDPQDRIVAALAYPDLFMNSSRVNIFAVDAYEQLSLGAYKHTWDHNLQTRWPLIIEAIASDLFGPDDIGRILDTYEAVCVNRGDDPHVFLNLAFRDNSLARFQFRFHFGNDVYDICSPFHAAVYMCRKDIIDCLIGRGANPIISASLLRSHSPYEYATKLFRNTNKGEILRRCTLEDIAIQLSSTSPNTAYKSDLSDVSPEMYLATDGGMDRLGLHLLKRFQDSDQAGSVDGDMLRNNQENLLTQCICGGRAMPRMIRRLFELGVNCRGNSMCGRIGIDYGDSVPFSHCNMALVYYYQGANASAILRWEIETEGAQTPREEVFYSIATIANFARDDRVLEVVRDLARILVELGHIEGQQRLLWYSIEGGQKSYATRKWLLNNLAAVDAITLRHAICYRDRDTAEFIIARMLNRGESIDEKLEGRRDEDPGPDIWYETPLTIALAQEDYQAAANLLTLGADPSKVPANIRHRICDIQSRIRIGHITDLVKFALRNRTSSDETSPTEAEARATLEFVFERLLRDPAHPLPPYDRPQIRPDHPAKHAETDSDHGDLLEGLNGKMVPKTLLETIHRSD